jgi:hypothetical protein
MKPYQTILLVILMIALLSGLTSCTIYTYPSHESKCGYQKIKTRDYSKPAGPKLPKHYNRF